MGANVKETTGLAIKKPPVGLAVLALVGPSFVWAAEYIGSGEVIIATRTGAILGTAVLWP
jgi:Mn2+/Fe2+ NRAMP family transporter